MFEKYNDILTPPELAEALGIGINSSYKLVNEGIVSSIRIGNKIIIPKTYLLDFIEKNRNHDTISADRASTSKGG